jgi:hypothetical protein
MQTSAARVCALSSYPLPVRRHEGLNNIDFARQLIPHPHIPALWVPLVDTSIVAMVRCRK